MVAFISGPLFFVSNNSSDAAAIVWRQILLSKVTGQADCLFMVSGIITVKLRVMGLRKG
jgi:hypothetical protein